jgi:8-oxo-dGTP pyrophosphatase MutT (NUDIX family)
VKTFLMHRNDDFDLERELPASELALEQDLELSTLVAAMAAGDPFLLEVARRALLLSLDDPVAIVYRQRVLADCLENAATVRALYQLAGEALKAEKSVWGGIFSHEPRAILRTSVEKMELLVGFLRQLRELADRDAAAFRSDGFKRFYAMVAEELDEQYFELIESQLSALRFRTGIVPSAALGPGGKGADYTLRRQREQSWLGRISFLDRTGYTFTIPDRDDNGFKALGELEDRAVNLVANALAQSVDHVRSFFVMLRIEAGCAPRAMFTGAGTVELDCFCATPRAAPSRPTSWHNGRAWVDEGGTWGIPGGAIRDGESPETAARRETVEELGLLPPYHRTGIEVQDCGGGWLFHVITGDVDHEFEVYCAQETDTTGWFSQDAMRALALHPGMRRWLDEHSPAHTAAGPPSNVRPSI